MRLSREGGHMVRFRVHLLVEEYRDVAFDHIPKHNGGCRGS